MEKSLKEGERAPDFNLPGSDGKNHSLSDYKGKHVVLYFYPKDNTPGCTLEAKGFSEAHEDYQNINAVVLGVSRDSLESHNSFIEELNIPFVLLSDEKGQAAESYHVMKEGSSGFKRSTFLIDDEGILRKIYHDVNPDNHAGELLEELKKDS